MPNADHESKSIFNEMNKFVKKNKNSAAFKSIGSLAYLSCLKSVDVILGNSSSGLLEAPTLKIPTINVGNRQKGRLKAKSVIDCRPKQKEIFSILTKLLNGKRKNTLKSFKNPYGEGGASNKIAAILEKTNYNKLLKKSFISLNKNYR